MTFPIHRLRRLRESERLRRLIAETQLNQHQFIYPMFIVAGSNKKQPIPPMPQQYRLSVDNLRAELHEINELKIPGVLLFGVPEKKDEIGSEAYNPEGVVQQAIKEIKSIVPEMLVITDVCLCEYTTHGHCGVVKNGRILNDPSLEIIAKTALSHVQAGADMVAPSDMMDGRVAAIRNLLDQNRYSHIPIMSYAAKYASAFYGPFRVAAESTPQFGDRKSYQMDYSNSREALREIHLDIEEGADIIMIKPALPYLDIISLTKQNFRTPIAAFQVSGEYSMIKSAAASGWIDEEKVMIETITAIKRAGADIIITYFAKDIARILSQHC